MKAKSRQSKEKFTRGCYVKTLSLNGIRGRLLLLLLIVLIPVLLIEAFTFYRRFESRKFEEFRANLEVARGAAKSFDTFIQDLVHSELVIGLALTPSQPVTGRDRNRILDQFQADHPAVRSIFWMSAHGLVIASSLRSYVGYDLGDRSFFQKVKEGRKWAVSELIVGRATGKPAFTVSCGIRNEQGKLLGVVAASVEPDRLDSVLGIERSKEAGVSLLDNKGMIVFRYPPIAYTWEQRNLLKQYPVIEDSLKGKEVLTSLLAESTGKRRLAAFTPVSSIGWVAAAGRAEDEAMKATTSAILFEAGLVLFVTFVGFGAAMAFAHPISGSIIGLRNQALALGRGETENLAMASGPDELKDLAVAFNQMAGEVRQREAALRESEQRWATTLASLGDAVIATDVDGKVAFMNAMAEKLTGWTISETAMKPATVVFNIINERTRKQVESPITKVLREGMVVGLANHTILVRKDGTEVPIDDSGAPIKNSEGKTLGVVLVFHDIAERKKAEEALKRTNDRFQVLTQNLSSGVALIDEHGRFSIVNPAFLKMFDLKETSDIKNVNDRNWGEWQVFDEKGELLEVDEHPVRKAVMTGKTVSNQLVAVRAPSDSRLRWMLISAAPILKPNDQLDAVICTYHDVTERKQAEEALRDSEERFRQLADASFEGLVIHAEGLILDVNKRVTDMLGYDPVDLVGKPFWEFIDTNYHDLVKENVRKGSSAIYEVELIHVDGRLVPVEVIGRSLTWRGRQIRVAALRDITERKQGEEALQQRTLELEHLTETLEERVKERTAELATLSSELLVAQEKERKRTAYNLHDNVWQTLEIIKTQLENLFSRGDEADWAAYHRKAKQLTPVIRDTIARVRSMQGDLWPSVLDDIGIVATLEWYCREFGINHPGLGIEKNVGLAEEEVPALAKIVIYRVMQEALSNVAKHSQANHVSLSLTKSDHRVEFCVKDNGVGFDPEETIVNRNPWGGLGLRSMKERTELSGGLFGVESAKGKGTTVRASWPLSENN